MTAPNSSAVIAMLAGDRPLAVDWHYIGVCVLDCNCDRLDHVLLFTFWALEDQSDITNR